MIAPDRSIETMKQAKEAVKRGEFVELPSPHAPGVNGAAQRSLSALQKSRLRFLISGNREDAEVFVDATEAAGKSHDDEPDFEAALVDLLDLLPLVLDPEKSRALSRHLFAVVLFSSHASLEELLDGAI